MKTADHGRTPTPSPANAATAGGRYAIVDGKYTKSSRKNGAVAPPVISATSHGVASHAT
jgi:hypothetical protein